MESSIIAALQDCDPGIFEPRLLAGKLYAVVRDGWEISTLAYINVIRIFCIIINA